MSISGGVPAAAWVPSLRLTGPAAAGAGQAIALAS
jgi:hypothetical protein